MNTLKASIIVLILLITQGVCTNTFAKGGKRKARKMEKQATENYYNKVANRF